jgi:hypothetical protein
MGDIKLYKGSELVDIGVYKDSDGYLIGNLFIYAANQTMKHVNRIDIDKLKKSLEKIELQLSKCRTSVMEDGWQTMKYAKKARKWDVLAQEKMRVKQLIEEYEKI